MAELIGTILGLGIVIFVILLLIGMIDVTINYDKIK